MKPNLTSSLVDELRRRIVEGEIAPGEKLPSESALIAERGVSRTVVREALTRLQAEGLVHTRRGAGSFALTPPSDAGVAGGARPARTLEERLELLGYRLAIEPEAAALAASGPRGVAQLSVLRAELKAFVAAEGNPASALAHDFAFHRAVAEASGNRYLSDAVDALGPAMISMPRRRLDAAAGPADTPRTPSTGPGMPTDRFQQVAAEHAAVLAAIEEGDALGAAAAMRAHLQNSRRRLRTEAG